MQHGANPTPHLRSSLKKTTTTTTKKSQPQLSLPMVDAASMAKPTLLIAARIAFCTLGFVTFFTVLYTCITDGTPFRKDLLTPWMTATLVDFYVNVAAIAIWVCYKESSWISALVWTILLICFGSMTTCWYITIELFKLSPQDPIYFVLLKDRHSSHTSFWVGKGESLKFKYYCKDCFQPNGW